MLSHTEAYQGSLFHQSIDWAGLGMTAVKAPISGDKNELVAEGGVCGALSPLNETSGKSGSFVHGKSKTRPVLGTRL